jgi:hypothetical protein
VRPDGRGQPNGDPDGQISEKAGCSNIRALVAQTAALTEAAQSD